MPCVYLCFFTQVELGISTIWRHFPLLTKMNGLLSSFWLVAIFASLWDVALFPQQPWCIKIRGASASSGLLLVNQACAIQCGEQDFPERMRAHSARGALNSWFIITSWKPGAKSRFVNQVFLFRIYWHDLKICLRTCKSLLGFVNPFKDMEINFWAYRTLKQFGYNYHYKEERLINQWKVGKICWRFHKLNPGFITSGEYKFINPTCESSKKSIRFGF